MSDNKLNQSEFAFVEQTLMKEIQRKKAEREKLASEIEAAEITLKKLRGYASDDLGKSTPSTNDVDFDLFCSIYREANGRYLTRDHVFTQYHVKTGRKLTGYRYRTYHKGRGDISFKMKGERGSAKWKIVEASEAN